MRLTISRKLGLSVFMTVAMVFLFAALAVYVLDHLNQEYRTQVVDQFNTKLEAKTLDALTWKLRTHVRDFDNNQKAENKLLVEETLAEIFNVAESIKNNQNQTELNESADQLHKSLEEWKQTFVKLNDLYIKRGTSNSEGVIGQLKQTAADLNEKFKETESGLQQVFHSMCRHEEIYLLNQEHSVFDDTFSLSEKLISSLSETEAANSAELVEGLKEYQKNFNQLSELDRKIQEHLLSMDKLTSRMISDAKELLDQVSEATDNHLKHMQDFTLQSVYQMAGVAFIFIVVLLVGGFMFSRNINKILGHMVGNLVTSVNQLTTVAGQIAHSSIELSERANDQATTIQTTSDTINTVSHEVKETAENASNVSNSTENVVQILQRSEENAKMTVGLAEDARLSAQNGVVTMDDIAYAMQDIQNGSEKITSIVDVISNITQQTKMLATNAAIEAARAGEQGKGFAVVADEVSKLAENSKQAAKEIGNLVQDNVRNAQEGGMLAEQGEKALQDILERFAKVTDLIREIHESSADQVHQITSVEEGIVNIKQASSKQAHRITSVNESINQMSLSTESYTSNSEETASAASELSIQVEALMDLVNEMSAHVGKKVEDSAFSAVPDINTPAVVPYEAPSSISSSLESTSPNQVGSQISYSMDDISASDSTTGSPQFPDPVVKEKSRVTQKKATDIIPMRDDFTEF